MIPDSISAPCDEWKTVHHTSNKTKKTTPPYRHVITDNTHRPRYGIRRRSNHPKDSYRDKEQLPLSPRTNKPCSREPTSSMKAVARCGWEQNCLLEALFLEAVSCIQEGSVFNYTGVTLHDDQVDLTHIRLACDTGDLETTFNVMKAWTEQLKEGREPAERWCQDNGLSSNILRKIERHVQESYEKLPFIAPNVCFPPLKYSPDPPSVRHCWTTIAKRVFVDGLCIYRGHRTLGYIHLKSGGYFTIPNTSMLNFMHNHLPPFIISLSSDIEKGIHYPIVLSYADGEALFKTVTNKAVSEFVEENVVKPLLYTSDHVLVRRFNSYLGDLRLTHLHKGIQRVCGDSMYVLDNGLEVIHLYALEKYHEHLKHTLKEYNNTLIEKNKETIVSHFPSLSSPMRISLNPGGMCVGAWGPCHYTVGRVVNLPSLLSFSEDDVFDWAAKYNGKVVQNKENNSSTYWGEIHFDFPPDANLAFKKQLCESFFLEPVIARQPQTDDDKLTECLAEITQTVEIKVSCRTTQNNYSNIKCFWENITECFITEGISDFDITVSGLSDCDNYRASVYCFSLKTANLLLDAITSGRYGQDLSVTNLNSLETQLRKFDIALDKRMYSIFKDTLQTQMVSSKQIRVQEATSGHGRWKLEVDCDKKDTALKTVSALLDVLQPAAVWTIPAKIKQYFASTDSSVILEQVGKETKASMHISPDLDYIYIYGSSREVSDATSKLPTAVHVSFADSLKGNQCMWYYMEIHGKSILRQKQNMLRLVESTKELCSLWGVSQVKVYPRHSRIGFKCLLENSYTVKCAIARDLNSLGMSFHNVDTSHKECCVCYSTVPVDQCHTLQQCHHIYCLGCIKGQLSTALQYTTFPMNCAECDTAICHMDLVLVCATHKLTDLHHVHQASLNHFVRNHPDKYHACPKINCKGVVLIEDGIAVCLLCAAKTCGSCKELVHHPLSCEQYNERILSLDNWINDEKENRKRCPNCGVGIEKSGGCEHVYCSSCSKDICWKCLAVFESSNMCYGHMEKAHGGWFWA